MARILRISAPAATVIIGNPGVADVTIQDPQTLVLTGKSYGQTNLIVLDSAGQPDRRHDDRSGADAGRHHDGLPRAQARTTLACAPAASRRIMLGDDAGYSSNTLASSSIVQSAAQLAASLTGSLAMRPRLATICRLCD